VPAPAALLLAALDLRPDGDGTFEASSVPGWSARIFGGQFLGQSVVAAGRTVGQGLAVHSLHGYFLRQGDPAASLRYHVTSLHDGRSFASRRVEAEQDGACRFVGLVSFARTEVGLDYQPVPALPPVADAPSLRSYGEWMAETTQRPEDGYETAARPRPVEVRYVDPPPNIPADALGAAEPGEPVTRPQRMWLRVPGHLPDDPLLHAAALAYASDETLVDNSMLPHGLRWSDARLQGASLDHAMWFCRPAAADRWLLFEQTVVSTAGGRGLVQGHLYTPEGGLVATAVQEGLIRLRAEPPAAK
jgi:acyl-CoA thioesterase-2